MRIDGLWYLCDDGVIRPVIRGEVRAADHSWRSVAFLVDSGADCTAFSHDVMRDLALEPVSEASHLSGVGGAAAAHFFRSAVRVPYSATGNAVFNGLFAGFVADGGLDMSVLGRDILNLFAVILDRPGEVVSLLSQSHRYAVTSK